MKAKLLKLFVPMALVFTLMSCSKKESDDAVIDKTLYTKYDYSADEVKLGQLINDYRVSIGLNPLEMINHISYKSQEHNIYMIDNNVVSHAFFEQRAENLVEVLGATNVGENIAYNFSTPSSVLYAWLNSPGHKANIEGDYTDFGISITVNEATGRKYYTNMFMKK